MDAQQEVPRWTGAHARHGLVAVGRARREVRFERVRKPRAQQRLQRRKFLPFDPGIPVAASQEQRQARERLLRADEWLKQQDRARMASYDTAAQCHGGVDMVAHADSGKLEPHADAALGRAEWWTKHAPDGVEWPPPARGDRKGRNKWACAVLKAVDGRPVDLPKEVQAAVFESFLSPLQVDTGPYVRLLSRYAHMFSERRSDFVGKLRGTVMRIDTAGRMPAPSRHYPRSPKEMEMIKAMVDDFLAAGVIEPCSSPISAPVVLVRKKDGTTRFCVAWIKTNAVTVADEYTMPRVEYVLQRLAGMAVFSVVDATWAFYQVPLHPDDRFLTAFRVPGRPGSFQFRVAGMGLKCSPAVWQRAVENALGEICFESAMPWLDDILVWSKDHASHLVTLERLLQGCERDHIVLKLRKCEFAKGSVEYIGFDVDKAGIRPSHRKVQAIADLLPPASCKDVKSHLQMLSFYQQFIERFAARAEPLRRLLTKEATARAKKLGFAAMWQPEQQAAWEDLKAALQEDPILAYPDFDKPFELSTDWSRKGIGLVLAQPEVGADGTVVKPNVVCYRSRALTKHERNYCPRKGEMLAIVWAVSKCKPYIWGQRTVVLCDHQSLGYLLNGNAPGEDPQLSRWCQKLLPYNLEIKYQPGAKQAADAWSRLTSKCGIPAADGGELPACNGKYCGLCRWLKLHPPTAVPEGWVCAVGGGADADGACAPQWALYHARRALEIGHLGVGEPCTAQSGWQLGAGLADAVLVDCELQRQCAVRHVAVVQSADDPGHGLGADGLDAGEAQVVLKLSEVVNTVGELVSASSLAEAFQLAQLRDAECQEKRLYVVQGKFPDTELKGSKLARWRQRYKAKMSRYSMSAKGLLQYAFSGSGPAGEERRQLIVVPVALRRLVFDLCHASKSAAHFKAEKTLSRVLRTFWWSGVTVETRSWVRYCVQCRRNRRPAVPGGRQQTYRFYRPFDAIQVDFAIMPESAAGNKYLFTAVCPFSGWLVVEPCRTRSAEEFAHVLYARVFTVFGAPGKMIADNERAFWSTVARRLIERFGVVGIACVPHHWQGRALVEATHRLVNEVVRTAVREAQPGKPRWEEFCFGLMMAHNASVMTGGRAGISPARLVFGRDMRVPEQVLLGEPLQVQRDLTEFMTSITANLRDAWAHTLAWQELRRHERLVSEEVDASSKSRLWRAPVMYKVGDLVDVWTPGAKKQEMYTGPWRVDTVRRNGSVYRVSRMGKDGNREVKRVCLSRLIPFVPSLWSGSVTSAGGTGVRDVDKVIQMGLDVSVPLLSVTGELVPGDFIGRRVRKWFDRALYEGVVSRFATVDGVVLFRVVYSDGDEEDFSREQVWCHAVSLVRSAGMSVGAMEMVSTQGMPRLVLLSVVMVGEFVMLRNMEQDGRWDLCRVVARVGDGEMISVLYYARSGPHRKYEAPKAGLVLQPVFERGDGKQYAGMWRKGSTAFVRNVQWCSVLYVRVPVESLSKTDAVDEYLKVSLAETTVARVLSDARWFGAVVESTS